MNEPSVSTPAAGVGSWRSRLGQLRAGLRRAIPFASGVFAALLALLVYNALFPPPPPLTTKDVNETIASALASATPPPAYSTRVYQVIQPSLVLIQTQIKTSDGKPNGALGSGVIIDDAGDILTSLHVVADASDIELIFADGTHSKAQMTNSQPENDIAVLQAAQPPAQIVPAVLGNPGAMQVGDQVFAVGNPFGLYSSMSAGVISGLTAPSRRRPANKNSKA